MSDKDISQQANFKGGGSKGKMPRPLFPCHNFTDYVTMHRPISRFGLIIIMRCFKGGHAASKVLEIQIITD